MKSLATASIAILASLMCLPSAADIPEKARQDARFQLGYLVATAYPGVASDGSGDSTAGLQQAIEDAYREDMTLLLPAGEYTITKPLTCIEWQIRPKASAPGENENYLSGTGEKILVNGIDPMEANHVLIGESRDGRRPVIRLAKDAQGFDDPEHPTPMITFRCIRATIEGITSIPELKHPLETPEGFENATAILFNEKMANIDFDCGGHPGAIGLHTVMAQDSTLLNIRVNAEGAFAGIQGVPGRNSVTGNIEVVGGRYGLMVEGSIAGSVIAGARLSNQTESAILCSDFSPMVLTGFEIKKKTAPVIISYDRENTCNGTFSLVDGSIEVEGGPVVLDNKTGKTIYLRNVFVKGASALIQSGKQEPVPASEGWNRIEEYSYNDQVAPQDDPPYEVGDNIFRVFSLIDGKLSQDPQPVLSVSQAEPPADLVQRHIWQELPLYTGNETTEIILATDAAYGATPDDESDDASAIQKAIDEASKAGHGRVFLPRGTYRIGSTIELKSNTVLSGVGWGKTVIEGHPDWLPEAGQTATMLETVDDPEANCVLAFLSFVRPAEPLTMSKEDYVKGITDEMIPPRNRFNTMNWRAGRNSMTVAVERTRVRTGVGDSLFLGNAVMFTGNGGGRHYSVHIRPPSAYPAQRPVLIKGTHEPLAIYGLNSESPYTPSARQGRGMTDPDWLDIYALETNTEITDSSNVRIYGVKREGASPSFIVRNSENVAIYSSGAMRNPVHPNLGGYIQFLGGNKNVMAAVVMVQAAKTLDGPEGSPQEALLREQLEGQDEIIIHWPDSLSIYRRGTIDDAPFAGN